MTQKKETQKKDDSVTCIHCHKKFNETRLIGITLICPFCGKPSDKLIFK